MSKFNEITLYSDYSDGFLGAAIDEKLITAVDFKMPLLRNAKKSPYKNRSLELFLLFDKIHLRGLPEDVRMPSLEHEGRVEIRDVNTSHWHKWMKNRLGVEKHGKESAELLAKTFYMKPFILEELISKYSKYGLNPELTSLIERHANVKSLSKRRVLNTILDFGSYYSILMLMFDKMQDEQDGIVSPLRKKYESSDDFVSNVLPLIHSSINSKLSEEQIEWFLTEFDLSLNLACRLLSIFEESAHQKIPIAWLNSPLGSPVDCSSSVVNDYEKTFHILRCSFKDENLVFPEVTSFSEVSRLRRDKRFADFRETLAFFAEEMAGGQERGIRKIRDDVKKANVALKSIGRCRKIGDIVTVLSLPTFIIDLIAASGIAGLSLSLIGTGIIVYSKIQEKQHNWILLGHS